MDRLWVELALLAASFAVIIAGAELFTNGVEWLGVRLSLSEGAVGSILAAVGTALPETLIPFVALVFFRAPGSHEVGLGAILGAPFMLATLAFFVTAAAAFAYRGRRETGARLAVNRSVLSRDLSYFLVMYAIAIGVSFAPAGHLTRWVVAAALVLGYLYYAYLNLRESAESEKEEPLMFDLLWVGMALLHPWADRQELHRTRQEVIDNRPPHLRAVGAQVVVALLLIVGGAYAFVHATATLSRLAGFSPLVFALIVAPVATELPEKLNSVIWIRQGKDTLSLGNITGAMVFQSTFPVTLGLLLTNWSFGYSPTGRSALLSAGIAIFSALLFLGVVRLTRGATISTWTLLAGLVWWLVFFAYTWTTVIAPGAAHA
jgi:cation:H+ antiporter